jgi:hypothetical protein
MLRDQSAGLPERAGDLHLNPDRRRTTGTLPVSVTANVTGTPTEKTSSGLLVKWFVAASASWADRQACSRRCSAVRNIASRSFHMRCIRVIITSRATSSAVRMPPIR